MARTGARSVRGRRGDWPIHSLRWVPGSTPTKRGTHHEVPASMSGEIRPIGWDSTHLAMKRKLTKDARRAVFALSVRHVENGCRLHNPGREG